MIDSIPEQAGVTGDLKKVRRGSALSEYCGSDTYRLPPHDIPAEQGILECCLLSPDNTLDEVLGRIRCNRKITPLNGASCARENLYAGNHD